MFNHIGTHGSKSVDPQGPSENDSDDMEATPDKTRDNSIAPSSATTTTQKGMSLSLHMIEILHALVCSLMV